MWKLERVILEDDVVTPRGDSFEPDGEGVRKVLSLEDLRRGSYAS